MQGTFAQEHSPRPSPASRVQRCAQLLAGAGPPPLAELIEFRQEVAVSMTALIDSMNVRVKANLEVMHLEHETLVIALGVVFTEHKVQQLQSMQAAVAAVKEDVRGSLQAEFNSLLRARDAAARDFGMHTEATRARMQASLDAAHSHITRLQADLLARNAEAVLHDAQMQTLLARMACMEQDLDEVKTTKRKR